MNQCLKIEPGRHRHDEENVPTQKGKMFCAGFCFAFFNFLGKIFRKWLTIRQSAGIITPVVRHSTDIWGISSAGRALAWHARGHRFDPGILHQKALYFVGSMVLFFLLEPVFGGCIASPAPFSGICRRFLYNPQLLTLHHFQKGMFAARFFGRLSHHPPSIDAAKGGGLPQ